MTHLLNQGYTNKTKIEFETYLTTIHHLFTIQTYDLINNNCNNFSDTICKYLVGHGIPSHIVDLPRIVFSTPGGATLRPLLESLSRVTGDPISSTTTSNTHYTNYNNTNYNNNNSGYNSNNSGIYTNQQQAGQFENALSEQVRTVISNNFPSSHTTSSTIQQHSSSTTTTTPYNTNNNTIPYIVPIETPEQLIQTNRQLRHIFTSTESGNIQSLIDKIITYNNGSLFTCENEKNTLRSLVPILTRLAALAKPEFGKLGGEQSSGQGGDQGSDMCFITYTTKTIISQDVALLIKHVLTTEPSLLITCLFLLRLLMLFQSPPPALQECMRYIMCRIKTPDGFKSHTIRAMAISVFVNCFSYNSNSVHALKNDTCRGFIIDLVTNGMSDTELPIRLICTALACNITYLFTKPVENREDDETRNVKPIWNSTYTGNIDIFIAKYMCTMTQICL